MDIKEKNLQSGIGDNEDLQPVLIDNKQSQIFNIESALHGKVEKETDEYPLLNVELDMYAKYNVEELRQEEIDYDLTLNTNTNVLYKYYIELINANDSSDIIGRLPKNEDMSKSVWYSDSPKELYSVDNDKVAYFEYEPAARVVPKEESTKENLMISFVIDRTGSMSQNDGNSLTRAKAVENGINDMIDKAKKVINKQNNATFAHNFIYFWGTTWPLPFGIGDKGHTIKKPYDDNNQNFYFNNYDARCNINPSGMTDISVGVDWSNRLYSNVDGQYDNYKKVTILLTDGIENIHEKSASWYSDQNDRAHNKGVDEVWSIGLGDNINPNENLKPFADSGKYLHAEDSSDVSNVFGQITQELIGETILHSDKRKTYVMPENKVHIIDDETYDGLMQDDITTFLNNSNMTESDIEKIEYYPDKFTKVGSDTNFSFMQPIKTYDKTEYPKAMLGSTSNVFDYDITMTTYPRLKLKYNIGAYDSNNNLVGVSDLYENSISYLDNEITLENTSNMTFYVPNEDSELPVATNTELNANSTTINTNGNKLGDVNHYTNMFIDDSYIYIGKGDQTTTRYDKDLNYIDGVSESSGPEETYNINDISSDNNYIYSASSLGIVYVYYKSSIGNVGGLDEGGNSTAYSVHNDSNYVYTGHSNNNVYVYNKTDVQNMENTTTSADAIHTLTDANDIIYSISSDADYLYIGSRGSNVYVYDKNNSFNLVNTLTEGNHYIYSVDNNTDYLYTAQVRPSSTDNSKIFIYDKNNNFNLINTITFSNRVWEINADDEYVYAATSYNHQVLIYDTDNYDLQYQLNESSQVREVHTDDNYLYVGVSSVSASTYYVKRYTKVEGANIAYYKTEDFSNYSLVIDDTISYRDGIYLYFNSSDTTSNTTTSHSDVYAQTEIYEEVNYSGEHSDPNTSKEEIKATYLNQFQNYKITADHLTVDNSRIPKYTITEFTNNLTTDQTVEWEYSTQNSTYYRKENSSELSDYEEQDILMISSNKKLDYEEYLTDVNYKFYDVSNYNNHSEFDGDLEIYWSNSSTQTTSTIPDTLYARNDLTYTQNYNETIEYPNIKSYELPAITPPSTVNSNYDSNVDDNFDSSEYIWNNYYDITPQNDDINNSPYNIKFNIQLNTASDKLAANFIESGTKNSKYHFINGYEMSEEETDSEGNVTGTWEAPLVDSFKVKVDNPGYYTTTKTTESRIVETEVNGKIVPPYPARKDDTVLDVIVKDLLAGEYSHNVRVSNRDNDYTEEYEFSFEVDTSDDRTKLDRSSIGYHFDVNNVYVRNDEDDVIDNSNVNIANSESYLLDSTALLRLTSNYTRPVISIVDWSGEYKKLPTSIVDRNIKLEPGNIFTTRVNKEELESFLPTPSGLKEITDITFRTDNYKLSIEKTKENDEYLLVVYHNEDIDWYSNIHNGYYYSYDNTENIINYPKNEKEYYLYKDEKEEELINVNSEVTYTINDNPVQHTPILALGDSEELDRVFFNENSQLTLYNTEEIDTDNGIHHLEYRDVVIDDIEPTTYSYNKIENRLEFPDDEVTGYVRYKVNDTYIAWVESGVLNIKFANNYDNVKVNYEGSHYSPFYLLNDISLNPFRNDILSGFIYLSDKNNDVSQLDITYQEDTRGENIDVKVKVMDNYSNPVYPYNDTYDVSATNAQVVKRNTETDRYGNLYLILKPTGLQDIVLDVTVNGITETKTIEWSNRGIEYE